MVSRSPGRHLCLIILWLLLKLALAGSVGAATLSMESFLGFNEHFQPGNWTPLTLMLENRGRDVEGSLEVIVTSGSEYLQNVYQSIYTADVELPYNAKRLYTFSIKLNSFTHDLQIRLKQGDDILLSRSISLRSAAMEKPFVLVADEKASPDFLSDFPPQVFPVNVRPKFLPEHSPAYESVRMMILNIEVLPKLRENQFQALLEWIGQGGYLVLNGGMNVGAFSAPRVRQLFPARILGHREFVELESLQDFCGQGFRSTTPFLLLHIQSQDAKVLLREGEFPILALRDMGKGRVLFSAFHYHVSVFRAWDGKREFWKTLLALHDPAKNAGSPTLPAPKIQDAMFRNMPVSIPNSKTLILILGLYLMLLRWIFRRIQQHRGHQWGNVIVSLALVFFSVFGSYLLFRAKNKNVLSHNVFLHLHGNAPSQQAEAKYVTGLYTIQETEYTLFFDSASYPVDHLPGLRSGGVLPQAYRVHQTVGGQEIRGRSGDWRSQFFQLSGTVEFPLSAEARLNENGLELLLRNASDRTIQNCRVYIQQDVFSLDDLGPGEEQRHQVPLEEIQEQEVFDPRKFALADRLLEKQTESPESESQFTKYASETLRIFFTRKNAAPYMRAMQRTLLPDILEAVHARYQTKPDRVCLFGWLPESPIEAKTLQKELPRESITLLTWEIPLQKQ